MRNSRSVWYVSKHLKLLFCGSLNSIIYVLRLFYNITVDYKAALVGARRAEDASDLNSTEPESQSILQTRALRKRKYLHKVAEGKSKVQPQQQSSSDDFTSEEENEKFPTPKLGLVTIPQAIVPSGKIFLAVIVSFQLKIS